MQSLSRDEQWGKLATWLDESIAALRRGDLSRLPESFTGERAETAIEAYRTVQEAMNILENWQVRGLPKTGE